MQKTATVTVSRWVVHDVTRKVRVLSLSYMFISVLMTMACRGCRGVRNTSYMTRKTVRPPPPLLPLLTTSHLPSSNSPPTHLSTPHHRTPNQRHSPHPELPAHLSAKTLHARKRAEESRDGARRAFGSFECSGGVVINIRGTTSAAGVRGCQGGYGTGVEG